MKISKRFGWILTALLVCAPSVARDARACDRQEAERPAGRQDRGRDGRSQDSRWKWWINPDDRKEFGITDQQSAQIEQIFVAYRPGARARVNELEKLEDTLARTIKEATADVASVTHLVSRVEKLRADQTTARTIMLYRIMQVLTPEQRPKIEALLARRAEARRRQQSEKDKGKHEAH